MSGNKKIVENLAKKGMAEISKHFQQKMDEYENTTLKCGIIGRSGVGKSSIINAIVGENIAKTGETEQTMQVQEHKHGSITYVDLPGCGTESFPKDSYISKFNLLNGYDCFIIVMSNRVFEDDVYLYQELKKANIPCFIVRNQIDIAIDNEKYENTLSEEETLNKVRKFVIEKTQAEKVYLVSARKPLLWDMPILLEDIINSQDGYKRRKLIAELSMLSENIFELKKEEAIEIVTNRAYLAAINGINPIPGLDVSIDLGILYNMVKEVNQIFGLSEKQIKYLEKTTSISQNPMYAGIKQNILKFIAQYTNAEAITTILKKFSSSITSKEFSKYIPFIGQAISATISYKMTRWLGEDYIDNAIKLSSELIEIELKNKK